MEHLQSEEPFSSDLYFSPIFLKEKKIGKIRSIFHTLTLKIGILRCSRRLLIRLVCLTVTCPTRSINLERTVIWEPRPIMARGRYIKEKTNETSLLNVSFPTCISRWVSVVEFHDQALGIGKVFGQESTVVKWNYQILGLHQVTVHQKLGVILVIKWFVNWSQQKMLFTKKVRLNWYSSMKFFF